MSRLVAPVLPGDMSCCLKGIKWWTTMTAMQLSMPILHKFDRNTYFVLIIFLKDNFFQKQNFQKSENGLFLKSDPVLLGDMSCCLKGIKWWTTMTAIQLSMPILHKFDKNTYFVPIIFLKDNLFQKQNFQISENGLF